MGNQILKFGRSSDKGIVDVFEEISKNLDFIPITNGRSIGPVQLGILDFKAGPKENWELLLDQDSSLLEFCSMSIGALNIYYHRGGSPDQNGKRSPIFDEIHLDFNESQQNPSAKDRLKIAAILTKRLNLFDPDKALSTSVLEEARNVEALHQMRLERLEKISTDLIEKNTEFRQTLEKAHHQVIEKLELDFANKKESLSGEYKKREETLEDERKKLIEKLSSIDDRDNTHVRREIRDRMLDDVKSRINNFGVSKATSAKRNPIAMALISLIVLLSFLLFKNITELEIFQGSANFSKPVEHTNVNNVAASQIAASKDITLTKESFSSEPTFYLLWCRLAALSLGLVGTILYYIRWQNRWAEHHANAEFQLQQFYIDINRVNWVIESCLEWKKETNNADIPETLLESMTKNLFRDDALPKAVLHPADELASALIGSASKLRLKAGENEIEFNNPKKIPKEKEQ